MGKKLYEKKNTDNETKDKKKDAEDEQKVGNGEEGAQAETDNDEKEAELAEDVLERVEDAAQGKKIDEASEGHLGDKLTGSRRYTSCSRKRDG